MRNNSTNYDKITFVGVKKRLLTMDIIIIAIVTTLSDCGDIKKLKIWGTLDSKSNVSLKPSLSIESKVRSNLVILRQLWK